MIAFEAFDSRNHITFAGRGNALIAQGLRRRGIKYPVRVSVLGEIAKTMDPKIIQLLVRASQTVAVLLDRGYACDDAAQMVAADLEDDVYLPELRVVAKEIAIEALRRNVSHVKAYADDVYRTSSGPTSYHGRSVYREVGRLKRD